MSEQGDDAVRAGRLRLLAVAAVFVVPVLVAVAWYFAAPRLAPGGSAHGSLIEPARPLEPFEVPRANGDPFGLDDLRGRWTLVHVIGDACEAACRERVHYTRQIRAALGEDRLRVQRVALAHDGAGTRGLASILDAHPYLTVLESPAGGPLRRQLPEADASTVLLIDPHGNLMMRFRGSVEPSDILDDLEHLLKLSRIG
ncbi:MAG: hypothetical protein U5K43_03585 [Halofilum sp. (in: g-proteobacteria)]|nr:hypothetical protein [Halofilum sp. (in: g-proteobacteria)]